MFRDFLAGALVNDCDLVVIDNNDMEKTQNDDLGFGVRTR